MYPNGLIFGVNQLTLENLRGLTTVHFRMKRATRAVRAIKIKSSISISTGSAELISSNPVAFFTNA
jgi:hypothetical protein